MNEFVIEEYRALVTEAQKLMAEARQLELYCAGAVAAICSWFLTSNVPLQTAWLLPIAIPVLGLLRSWALYERVKQISLYVRETESFFLSNTPQIEGWENSYAKIREHGLTPTALLFWILLILLCLALPFLFGGIHA
jgi:hypothetical protein